MTIERRACVNDINPEELTINTFGEKFTVLDLENSWSNFQTRKKDAPISSKLVSKNLWKKLKYDRKRISKGKKEGYSPRDSLNNCNFRSILLYFSCISTFSIIPTSIFSLQEVAVFPKHDSPRVCEIATISVQPAGNDTLSTGGGKWKDNGSICL